MGLSEWNFEGGLPYWGHCRVKIKALETGICFHRGSVGEPGKMLVY
jgi:hypothetical protein